MYIYRNIFLVEKFLMFFIWKKTFLPPYPKLGLLFCPNHRHLLSLLEKRNHLFYQQQWWPCRFVQCKRTTRCRISKEARHKLPLHCYKCFRVAKISQNGVAMLPFAFLSALPQCYFQFWSVLTRCHLYLFRS